MSKNKELEAFYQSVYLKGEKKHFTPFVTKGTTSSEAQEVIKEMKWKGKRVLDVGCGTGNFAKEVSKNNAKYVLGIDYAEEAIKIAQKNNKQKNLEFKKLDVNELNEKFGRQEATKAVMLGFVANIAVMLTLLISVQFKPSDIAGSALEVHEAISTLASYSPTFVIGSLIAYLVSQRFDVWIFHKLKVITEGKYLWLRNNVSTISSQALDTFLYTFVWVIAGEMSFGVAFGIALTKYVFKVIIALIDTIFIYWVRKW